MMQALADLPAADLEVQHGPATAPACARTDVYLPFDEIVKRIERAEVVVSHAGVGSIICAVRAGHTPVIFPRLKRYSETVDDHQAELAEALAGSGLVIVAKTAAELAHAVASAPRRGTVRGAGGQELNAAVRAAIMGGRTGGIVPASRRALGLRYCPRTAKEAKSTARGPTLLG